ncbi:hypothetical protein CTI12_AA563970 [Artemisia annua]|uniref:Retrotransposon Copia-like N-terminal domain-containing protein n=1 Tax=Artemisia annua TaxID=35608 RepID=A0A2U1KV41_ARTAN|nr:hypothetical protein CTI12_AA563970 [Artemisia annua]
MTTPDPTPPAIFENPLYLHPSDGPGSLTVQEKLIGAQNYRAWRRAIEIGLSTKRKLAFIKGTVVRSNTDANLAELWDTCKNMVICWIMGSVSESIAISIMFVGIASEIWMQLERMFSLSDGSRKYKLNKDTYEITQSGGSVGEYYTKMNVGDSTALFTKGVVKDSVSNGKCSICGFKWHPPERYWEKVGYPTWHAKYKPPQQRQQYKNGNNQVKNQGVARTAAHVESGSISFTPQQFEQLLKSVQQMKGFNLLMRSLIINLLQIYIVGYYCDSLCCGFFNCFLSAVAYRFLNGNCCCVWVCISKVACGSDTSINPLMRLNGVSVSPRQLPGMSHLF